MATTLRDFLNAREAEIKDQLKRLRLEMAEIRVARQALDGVSEPAASAVGASGASPTIKDMVRSVLKEVPLGLTSAEILLAIKRVFDKELERTSLSPQLSRLKHDGAVVLDGETWFIRENWEAREAAAAAWVDPSRIPLVISDDELLGGPAPQDSGGSIE
jgi:hypothetical protein